MEQLWALAEVCEKCIVLEKSGMFLMSINTLVGFTHAPRSCFPCALSKGVVTKIAPVQTRYLIGGGSLAMARTEFNLSILQIKDRKHNIGHTLTYTQMYMATLSAFGAHLKPRKMLSQASHGPLQMLTRWASITTQANPLLQISDLILGSQINELIIKPGLLQGWYWLENKYLVYLCSWCWNDMLHPMSPIARSSEDLWILQPIAYTNGFRNRLDQSQTCFPHSCSVAA